MGIAAQSEQRYRSLFDRHGPEVFAYCRRRTDAETAADCAAETFLVAQRLWFALGFLETLECGKMRVMAREITSGKPTTRRYTKEERERAVRLVFQLREELGMSQGTVVRVADQLGYGTESVRRWVAQAEIDAGGVAGISTAERAKMKKLEQENRELRRANEILKRASAFFAAELDRPQK